MQQPSPAKAIPGLVVSKFDNSGSGPLLVPGFSGMTCFVEAEPEVGRRRFGYAIHNRWPMRATAREIAMIRAMENVTDRPNWHQDVFSEEKLAEWKEEATAADWKISDKAWAWCVLELQDKAGRFLDTGRTVVPGLCDGCLQSRPRP